MKFLLLIPLILLTLIGASCSDDTNSGLLEIHGPTFNKPGSTVSKVYRPQIAFLEDLKQNHKITSMPLCVREMEIVNADGNSFRELELHRVENELCRMESQAMNSDTRLLKGRSGENVLAGKSGRKGTQMVYTDENGKDYPILYLWDREISATAKGNGEEGAFSQLCYMDHAKNCNIIAPQGIADKIEFSYVAEEEVGTTNKADQNCDVDDIIDVTPDLAIIRPCNLSTIGFSSALDIEAEDKAVDLYQVASGWSKEFYDSVACSEDVGLNNFTNPVTEVLYCTKSAEDNDEYLDQYEERYGRHHLAMATKFIDKDTKFEYVEFNKRVSPPESSKGLFQSVCKDEPKKILVDTPNIKLFKSNTKDKSSSKVDTIFQHCRGTMKFDEDTSLDVYAVRFTKGVLEAVYVFDSSSLIKLEGDKDSDDRQRLIARGTSRIQRYLGVTIDMAP